MLAWILGGLVVWALVAVAGGAIIGRGIRLADIRTAGTGPGPRSTADLPPGFTPAPVRR